MMHDYGRVSVKTFYDSVYYCHKCTCALEGAGRVAYKITTIIPSKPQFSDKIRTLG